MSFYTCTIKKPPQITYPRVKLVYFEFLCLQKTIVGVLDCLISPRWPHPPCLPSDIVPCLSWQQLQDTPTNFHVTYDILESDVNGRFPDDAEYEYTPKSCYYNLAKHCNQTLNKVHKQITALGYKLFIASVRAVLWQT